MKATDISQADYFHKVVDCQWACPAHTPVPEYIRLISAGDYVGAYMINWKSNVFPGILGRTCDRPCEPACRRGRVEEQPVAICRLKRVAADYKGDISAFLPKAPTTRNGKRIACVGAGPASLTVARDLAPLGYDIVVFDADLRAGGMMRSQIPKFRLPDSVIDEEVGYVLDGGAAFVAGRRIDSLKALLGEGYDAIFVGSGAPRGRDLDFPGRKEAAAQYPYRHRLARQRLVRPCQRDRPARHRARRRQYGDGLLPLLAPPRRRRRQGRRALRLRGDEGVVLGEGGRDPRGRSDPQLSRAQGFPARERQADRHDVREGRRDAATKTAAASLRRPASPTFIIACDDVLIAVGQENAFPWIEPDSGVAFDRDGLPKLDPLTFQSSLPSRVLRRRFGVRAEEHHHRGRAWPRGGDFDRRLLPRRRARPMRPPPMTNLVSQKMGIHEWSYDNAITLDRRFKVPHDDNADRAEEHRAPKSNSASIPSLAVAEAQRCLNCDVQTVFSEPACIECDACVDICPIDCISFVAERAGRAVAPLAQRAGRQSFPGDLCLGAGQDRPRHGQGRGPLPALRPLRRALPDRGVGHAEIHSRNGAGGACMPIQGVNDFVIRFANVNGSGSASANLLFARSILRMGVPIAPRNIFPSNIQGLPTWYEVRVTAQGYLGARGGTDLMVAMNPQTFDKDVASIEPGGYLFYDSSRPIPASQAARRHRRARACR